MQLFAYVLYTVYLKKMPDKPSGNSVKICATQIEWRTGWTTILRESENNIERGLYIPWPSLQKYKSDYYLSRSDQDLSLWSEIVAVSFFFLF